MLLSSKSEPVGAFKKSSLLTWMIFTSWKLVITITLVWHEGSVMTGEVVGCQEVPLSSQPSDISLPRGFPKPAVFFLSSSRSYCRVPMFCTSPDLHTYLLTCSSFTSLFLIPATQLLCLLPACFLPRFPTDWLLSPSALNQYSSSAYFARCPSLNIYYWNH